MELVSKVSFPDEDAHDAAQTHAEGLRAKKRELEQQLQATASAIREAEKNARRLDPKGARASAYSLLWQSTRTSQLRQTLDRAPPSTPPSSKQQPSHEDESVHDHENARRRSSASTSRKPTTSRSQVFTGDQIVRGVPSYSSKVSSRATSRATAAGKTTGRGKASSRRIASSSQLPPRYMQARHSYDKAPRFAWLAAPKAGTPRESYTNLVRRLVHTRINEPRRLNVHGHAGGFPSALGNLPTPWGHGKPPDASELSFSPIGAIGGAVNPGVSPSVLSAAAAARHHQQMQRLARVTPHAGRTPRMGEAYPEAAGDASPRGGEASPAGKASPPPRARSPSSPSPYASRANPSVAASQRAPRWGGSAPQRARPSSPMSRTTSLSPSLSPSSLAQTSPQQAPSSLPSQAHNQQQAHARLRHNHGRGKSPILPKYPSRSPSPPATKSSPAAAAETKKSPSPVAVRPTTVAEMRAAGWRQDPQHPDSWTPPPKTRNRAPPSPLSISM